jgi:transglutaminase-like putative cysteine protease
MLDVSRDPLAFLDHLVRTLHTGFEHIVRLSGNAQTAAETLAARRGACRDVTVLFMEASRSVGIASRFVSGYQARAETAAQQRYLHAWPEILVPGVGFRGWDPTHGVRVADEHLALAAAPEQEGTMPIEGGFTFIGETVHSTLDFSLEIETTR